MKIAIYFAYACVAILGFSLYKIYLLRKGKEVPDEKTGTTKVEGVLKWNDPFLKKWLLLAGGSFVCLIILNILVGSGL